MNVFACPCARRLLLTASTVFTILHPLNSTAGLVLQTNVMVQMITEVLSWGGPVIEIGDASGLPLEGKISNAALGMPLP